MADVDVGSIVPSIRDLLQAITTRRRNLALIALVDLGNARDMAESAAAEAARLAELNVSAFAVLEPGPGLGLLARATRTVPSLCLVAAADREAVLAAREHGSDGVVVDAALPLDAWDRLAGVARTMRMLPVALATDAAGLDAAAKAGARAILLRAGSAGALLELAASAPRGVTLIGHVEAADADAVRALAGKVDAAVVPPALHAAPSFAELVAEVDP